MSNEGVWDLTRTALQDFFAEARVAGSAPLVLDLDGAGLELRAVTASGQRFDVHGDQFAAGLIVLSGPKAPG